MDDKLIGALSALGSILFFGSYAVFMKPSSLKDVTVNPLVFQTYKSVACFATSWLVLLYVPFKFTWWGVLGAGLWVITGLGAVTAVRLAGIGPTQSIWSGLSVILCTVQARKCGLCQVLVSYIWGAYIFHEPVKNHLLGVVGVVAMVAGMCGVALAASGERDLSARIGKTWGRLCNSPRLKSVSRPSSSHGHSDADYDASKSLITGLEGGEGIVDEGVMDRDQTKYDADDQFILGVIVAVIVGITNGFFNVPLAYANKDAVGVEYVLSFGIGTMICTPSVLAIFCVVRVCMGQSLPSFQLKLMAVPALTTGLFWSAGNFCSIYATLYLGVSLGWPLVQCQLIVSAMWAVFYFKEVTNAQSVTLLLGSSLVVVAGAGVLCVFGVIS